MKLHTIETGFFKLDGGAMFGVVPKSLWQRLNPPDENNLCTWAMRCLLIEDGNKLILIDNGIGDKQDARFLSHYHLHGKHNLIQSLKTAGFSPADVTDMFLTHLHFDHCGGGVRRENEKLVLTFPKATYWTSPQHWQWATEPNQREKASFLRENIMPMQESGQLRMAYPDQASPLSQMDLFFVSGHTDHMMLPMIRYKETTVCYMADLIPSTGHIPVPYVMGYDTRPLLTMEEKEKFLQIAADSQYVLYFEHDPVHECCTVKHTEKGVRIDRTFALSEL
jgi:glyoxylase-like metal-dependent hydrolase (beta-lactamase superfamily II)